MDIQEQIAVIVHTVSHQGGRIDALNAALATTLHLVKESPGLKQAIEAQLEKKLFHAVVPLREPSICGRF